MTEITVTSTTYNTGDRSWLLFEADGQPGPVSRGTAEIDFSAFTSGTHYPNGYLPSGLVLGKITATGRLAPYVDANSNGTQTAVGILYNNITLPAGAPAASKVSAAYVRSFAAVSVSRLPANNGLDAAAQVDLKLIDFQA
jgi:hypothetical protein